MDIQKVDMYLMVNSKYFESHQLPSVRQRLLEMSDSQWTYLQTVKFNDPTTLLIVSLLVGSLGIDRFMNGEIGLGIAKLLTCGGLGIWHIIDLFLIMGATREKNYEKFNEIFLLQPHIAGLPQPSQQDQQQRPL